MDHERARNVLHELNRKLLLLCGEVDTTKRTKILESILDDIKEKDARFEDLCLEKQLKILLGLEEE